MRDASPSDDPLKLHGLAVTETWRRLNVEQRAAAVGALLLVVSTFGPFSFVEAAIVLVAAAVLLLLRRRAEGRDFHVPFGDGAVIMAGGVWSALLIVVRLFDRPLGQNLLALVCAAILALAGLRMRLRRRSSSRRRTPPRRRRCRARRSRRRGAARCGARRRRPGGDRARALRRQ